MNSVATMCMLGNRFPNSMPCVESIIDQVDKVYLCLNGFDDVPEALNDSKIQILHCGENLGAMARFSLLPKIDKHLVGCDDDLIYHKDYVSNLENLSLNLSCGFLTHHSKTVIDNKVNYISACLKANKVIQKVDIPGSGASFIHKNIVNKIVKLASSIKTKTQQTDVMLGVAAKCLNEEIMCVPQPEDYFKYVDPGIQNTIWAKETAAINLAEMFFEFYNQIKNGP